MISKVRYFNIIREKYNQKLLVSFDSLSIFPCREEEERQQFAIVRLSKKIWFANKTSNHIEYMVMNLASFKITEVVFPHAFKNGRYKPCSTELTFNLKSLFEQADKYLQNKNYKIATLILEHILLLDPGNYAASSILLKIKDRKTPEYYLSRIKQYEQNKQWESVRETYLLIATDYPDYQPEMIQRLIETSTQTMNAEYYNLNMNYAHFYFQNSDFSQSEIFLKLSLQYKPNDVEASNLLKEIRRYNKK
jgi:hypothetical protein